LAEIERKEQELQRRLAELEKREQEEADKKKGQQNPRRKPPGEDIFNALIDFAITSFYNPHLHPTAELHDRYL